MVPFGGVSGTMISSRYLSGTFALLAFFAAWQAAAATAVQEQPGATTTEQQITKVAADVAADDDTTATESKGDELPDLQTLLAQDSDGYPQAKRCLSVQKLHRTRIIDENHVVFELRGGRYYLAQLEHRCPGLTKNSTVSFVHRSSKVCAKDGIRGVPLTGGFTPSCQLPNFLPVTKEQIALLRDGLQGGTFETMKSRPISERPYHRLKKCRVIEPIGTST